jgi:transcriptional regulator with XRE-family HTH domain
MVRRAARADDATKILAENFGANVRVARERAGLSQEAFAEVSGIAQPTISKIEYGRFNLTLKAMARVTGAITGGSAPEIVETLSDFLKRSPTKV